MNTAGASKWTLIALLVGTIAVLYPFWAPLLFAAYVALATRNPMERLVPYCRGHRPLAAAITVVGVVAIAAPLIAMIATLLVDAIAFVATIRETQEVPQFLQALVAAPPTVADPAAPRSMLGVAELFERYSERAFQAIQYAAGAAVSAVLATLIFFVTLYSLLVSGQKAWEWALANLPLPTDETRRYGAAFVETGRGLIIGVGAAALVQGMIAGITFAALGVSRAVVLGVLTAVGAMIPGIGTAFVWLPVAAGLALSGRHEAAVIMLLMGVFVIGLVDNLLKPILAHHASLQLQASVVLVSMLGGLLAFGPAGILLGPLLVRLALEGVAIRRERIAAEHTSTIVMPRS